jgi:hypothetical protein
LRILRNPAKEMLLIESAHHGTFSAKYLPVLLVLAWEKEIRSPKLRLAFGFYAFNAGSVRIIGYDAEMMQ